MEELLLKIIEHYGWAHQLRKMSEETYELMEAVVNYEESASTQNLVSVTEEIADCKVVAMQFILNFGDKDKARERIEEIKIVRKNGAIKYSNTFLFLAFVDYAEEFIHLKNTGVTHYRWANEKLCGYVATIETLAAELQIDESVIQDEMSRKIKRQIERIKRGE